MQRSRRNRKKSIRNGAKSLRRPRRSSGKAIKKTRGRSVRSNTLKKRKPVRRVGNRRKQRSSRSGRVWLKTQQNDLVPSSSVREWLKTQQNDLVPSSSGREWLETQQNELVPSSSYNHLFADQTNTPPIMVSKDIWDTIVRNLPPDYQIPDKEFLHLLQNELSPPLPPALEPIPELVVLPPSDVKQEPMGLFT
jgi:hypothetical protein